ncbi:hypothetical protein MW887_002467 [Aspergillus wentii]|nr:hypothetical protein MW887_002467 [Aspergillus wentii]
MLLSRLIYMEELCLQDVGSTSVWSLTDTDFGSLLSHLPNLRKLVANIDLYRAALMLPQLKTLKVSGLGFSVQGEDRSSRYAGIHAVATIIRRHLPKLEYLDFADPDFLEDEELLEIWESMGST